MGWINAARIGRHRHCTSFVIHNTVPVIVPLVRCLALGDHHQKYVPSGKADTTDDIPHIASLQGGT